MNTRINQNAGVQYVSNRGVSESRNTAPGAATTATGKGDDKISLSSQADRLNNLTQLATDSPDIDMAKVEAIKAQIANGEFAVDAGRLAGKMLTADRLLGR